MRVVADYFIVHLVMFVPEFSSDTDGCSSHSGSSQDLPMRGVCFEVGPARQLLFRQGSATLDTNTNQNKYALLQWTGELHSRQRVADSVLLLPPSASSTKHHVPHSQARRQLTTEHECYICTLRVVLAHKHCEHRACAVQQAHRMLLHRMLPHKPSSSHLNDMGGIAGSGVVLKHGTADGVKSDGTA